MWRRLEEIAAWRGMAVRVVGNGEGVGGGGGTARLGLPSLCGRKDHTGELLHGRSSPEKSRAAQATMPHGDQMSFSVEYVWSLFTLLKPVIPDGTG